MLIKLTGAIVPKARPQVTSKGTFMPKRYREWKQNAITEILSQRQPLPPPPYRIKIALDGNHNRQGDLDNIAGAVLDAIVQAGIITNDNAKTIVFLSVEILHNPNTPPITIVNIA